MMEERSKMSKEPSVDILRVNVLCEYENGYINIKGYIEDEHQDRMKQYLHRTGFTVVPTTIRNWGTANTLIRTADGNHYLCVITQR